MSLSMETIQSVLEDTWDLPFDQLFLLPSPLFLWAKREMTMDPWDKFERSVKNAIKV